jgi:subtilisin family serine protease
MPEPAGTDLIRSVAPPAPQGAYPAALAQLRASRRTLIAHIDAGVAAHPSLGWRGIDPPPYLLVDDGANLFDPEENPAPVTPLRRSPGAIAGLLEYPDHGVKTLSVILGADAALSGVAPGVRIVPYRVSNGPLFRDGSGPLMPGRDATAALGQAMLMALALDPPARVMSISMGNPGWLGVYDFLVRVLGGRIGLGRDTGRAVDRAYEAGAILVCAAGQVIDRVVYPAAYARTIAVGGFDRRGALFDHYPPGGYARPELIDVWAQAERINRASFDLAADPPVPIHADDPRNREKEPSGTSYAAPQVAAAAALWVERWHDRLEAMFGAARWQIVEAFRAALRASADEVQARLLRGISVPIRALNIPRLLDTAPAEVTGPPAAPAASQGFW